VPDDDTFPATHQYVYALRSGAYAISRPLCEDHCDALQPAETAEILAMEPVDNPPECQRCLDEYLDGAEPVEV
jgi:hypothetical protein